MVEITKGFHNNLLQGLRLQFCSQNKGFLPQSTYNNNSFAIFVISYFDCIVVRVGCYYCYCCVMCIFLLLLLLLLSCIIFLHFLVVSRINIDEFYFWPLILQERSNTSTLYIYTVTQNSDRDMHCIPGFSLNLAVI